MGSVVDFDKGKRKVIEKRKEQEIQKKKRATASKARVKKARVKNARVKTAKSSRPRQKSFQSKGRVAMFYGALFGACVLYHAMSALL